MRHALSSVLITVAAAWISSQAVAAELAPTPDRAAVERQIRQAIANWVAATERGDSSEKSKIWAPGVEGWFPSAPEFKNTAAFDGTVDVRTLRSTYTVTINEVTVSTDLAVVRDTWIETIHAPDGATAHRVIQSFEVWQPQATGEWKISRWISAPGPWQRASKRKSQN
jgi:ketosteroid isomerase-like protein